MFNTYIELKTHTLLLGTFLISKKINFALFVYKNQSQQHQQQNFKEKKMGKY